MRSIDICDYFAQLGEVRRPWLDPEELRHKFLKLSADVHPDRVHNQTESEQQAAHRRYTDLNAAYQCLREPRDRLRHLLELEPGWSRANLQNIPSDLMDLSVEIGQACRQADLRLNEKASTTSPLLLAQQFQRNQEWAGQLQDLRQKVNAISNQLMDKLKSIDEAWVQMAPGSGERKALLGELEGICSLFGFTARWQTQLGERTVQLSL